METFEYEPAARTYYKLASYDGVPLEATRDVALTATATVRTRQEEAVTEVSVNVSYELSASIGYRELGMSGSPTGEGRTVLREIHFQTAEPGIGDEEVAFCMSNGRLEAKILDLAAVNAAGEQPVTPEPAYTQEAALLPPSEGPAPTVPDLEAPAPAAHALDVPDPAPPTPEPSERTGPAPEASGLAAVAPAAPSLPAAAQPSVPLSTRPTAALFDHAVQETLDSVEQLYGGDFQAEHATFGDLDGDGVEDGAVLIAYQAERNEYVQYLVAYLFNGGTFQGVATRNVSGRFLDALRADLERIADRRILVELEALEGSAACCTKRTAFALEGGQLVEVAAPDGPDLEKTSQTERSDAQLDFCTGKARELVHRLVEGGWTCELEMATYASRSAPAPSIRLDPAVPEADEALPLDTEGGPNGQVAPSAVPAPAEGPRPDQAVLKAALARDMERLDELAGSPPRSFQASMARLGDLNGDGLDDAVALLTRRAEDGSPSLHLLAYQFDGETFQPVARLALTETSNAQIQNLVDGVIEVVVHVAQPGDPACCPSGRRRVNFVLRDDELVRLPEDKPGT